ncbi:hypothetical protein BCAH1134_C0692 (plasmid) [Bacillus cereus AH1134]|nr:hypothetical protein BCAH1134_C0692 [Bacillus cereus AH1134]
MQVAIQLNKPNLFDICIRFLPWKKYISIISCYIIKSENFQVGIR